MNPLRLPFALALITLASAALAADEPPNPTPASTAAVAAPANVAQPAASHSVPASSASTSSNDRGNPGVRQMFCLNMSMQCFSVHQAAASTTAASASSPAPRRLDLNAPDIRRIVPEASLREPIQDEYEMLQETEQVQVEATRPEVYVPGGLVSLPWAVMHPTQAWRIFLPVNSAK